MAAQRSRSAHDCGNHQQLHGEPGVLRGTCGVPAAIADPVVYEFLSRAVVRGERIDDVFVPETPPILAVRITAALLVAFLPRPALAGAP